MRARSQGRDTGPRVAARRALQIGAVYCTAGVAIGIGAWRVGGEWSIPMWILAGLLFAAGVWTAGVVGLLVGSLEHAERQAAERDQD